jgi:hypothetical protein
MPTQEIPIQQPMTRTPFVRYEPTVIQFPAAKRSNRNLNLAIGALFVALTVLAIYVLAAFPHQNISN